MTVHHLISLTLSVQAAVTAAALELATRLEAQPEMSCVHCSGERGLPGCWLWNSEVSESPVHSLPAESLMTRLHCGWPSRLWGCRTIARLTCGVLMQWSCGRVAGLESHQDHAIAKAQMEGYGGVISFEVIHDAWSCLFPC